MLMNFFCLLFALSLTLSHASSFFLDACASGNSDLITQQLQEGFKLAIRADNVEIIRLLFPTDAIQQMGECPLTLAFENDSRAAAIFLLCEYKGEATPQNVRLAELCLSSNWTSSDSLRTFAIQKIFGGYDLLNIACEHGSALLTRFLAPKWECPPDELEYLLDGGAEYDELSGVLIPNLPKDSQYFGQHLPTAASAVNKLLDMAGDSQDVALVLTDPQYNFMPSLTIAQRLYFFSRIIARFPAAASALFSAIYQEIEQGGDAALAALLDDRLQQLHGLYEAGRTYIYICQIVPMTSDIALHSSRLILPSFEQ